MDQQSFSAAHAPADEMDMLREWSISPMPSDGLPTSSVGRSVDPDFFDYLSVDSDNDIQEGESAAVADGRKEDEKEKDKDNNGTRAISDFDVGGGRGALGGEKEQTTADATQLNGELTEPDSKLEGVDSYTPPDPSVPWKVRGNKLITSDEHNVNSAHSKGAKSTESTSRVAPTRTTDAHLPGASSNPWQSWMRLLGVKNGAATVPKDKTGSEATGKGKMANDLPPLFSKPLWYQTNLSLRAMLTNIDAVVAGARHEQTWREYKGTARPFIQQSGFDHVIGSMNLYSEAGESSIDSTIGGGIGGMEDDPDFQSFVDMAKFLPNRSEDPPFIGESALEVVRYVGREGRRHSPSEVYEPGDEPSRHRA